MRSIVLGSCVALALSAGAIVARPLAQGVPLSMQQDPLEPIAPTSESECYALGREWDRRIAELREQHNACDKQVYSSCNRLPLAESNQCFERETNPAYRLGDFPQRVALYSTCEGLFQAMRAAQARKGPAVQSCRAKVEDASRQRGNIPVKPSDSSQPSSAPSSSSSGGGPRPFVMPSFGGSPSGGGGTGGAIGGSVGGGTGGSVNAGGSAMPWTLTSIGADPNDPELAGVMACIGYRDPRPGESYEAWSSEMARAGTTENIARCTGGGSGGAIGPSGPGGTPSAAAAPGRIATPPPQLTFGSDPAREAQRQANEIEAGSERQQLAGRAADQWRAPAAFGGSSNSGAAGGSDAPVKLADPFGGKSAPTSAHVTSLLRDRLTTLQKLREENNSTFDAQARELASNYAELTRTATNYDIAASMSTMLVGLGSMAAQVYKSGMAQAHTLATVERQIALEVKELSAEAKVFAYEPLLSEGVESWAGNPTGADSTVTLFGKALVQSLIDMQSPSYWANVADIENGGTLAEAMARRPEDSYNQARQKLESIRQRSNAALDAKIAETQRLLDLANAAAR